MRRSLTILAALFITSLSAFTALAQRTMSVEPGRYEIEVTLTGKVLDLRKEDMRSVQQYFRGQVSNQQWDIQSAGGNSYYIRSAANGAYLTAESNREGGRVITTTGNRDTWRFVDLGNGNVMIVNKAGMTLDLTTGDTRDGAPIQVWSQARNTHQQFRLVPISVNAPNDPNNTDASERNEAYRMGVRDRAANLNRNYRRHRELYDRDSEREFEQNYNAGYDNGRNRGAIDDGRNGGVNNDDLSGMSITERRTYDEGYQLGRQDARSGDSANFRRYSDRYNRRQESFFQRGYEAGYNRTARNDRNNDDRYNNDRPDNDPFDLGRLSAYERRAYDDGYQLGRQDARSGSSLNYRRYNNRYDPRQEPFFRRGYEVGYNSARRQ